MINEKEYKLNGGETLVCVSNQHSWLLPTIVGYQVLPNPTEKRAKIQIGSSERKVNRLGYRQNGITYFQEVGGDGIRFRLMDKEIQELQQKVDLFRKVKKKMSDNDLFHNLTLEQLQKVAEIILSKDKTENL